MYLRNLSVSLSRNTRASALGAGRTVRSSSSSSLAMYEVNPPYSGSQSVGVARNKPACTAHQYTTPCVQQDMHTVVWMRMHGHRQMWHRENALGSSGSSGTCVVANLPLRSRAGRPACAGLPHHRRHAPVSSPLAEPEACLRSTRRSSRTRPQQQDRGHWPLLLPHPLGLAPPPLGV